MLTLLHISDFHFGPPYVERVGAALLEIAPKLAADVIVASGDFTQRAKPEQFQAARAFLDQLEPLKAPRVVVPGNHDVPLYRIFERFLRPRALYQKYMSAHLDHVLRVEGAVIVSLDSTAPRTAISNGRIHRRQLDFCAQAFADAPPGGGDAARIVVAHHHFAPAPDYEGGEVMPKAKRAIDRFLRLEVDLILGGHLHRAYIGNSLDVYPGIERERGIIIVQCGTTTSRRGRAREQEKNSFNLIFISAELIRITHYMFFDDAGGFAPASIHVFPRAHRGYLTAEPAVHEKSNRG